MKPFSPQKNRVFTGLSTLFIAVISLTYMMDLNTELPSKWVDLTSHDAVSRNDSINAISVYVNPSATEFEGGLAEWLHEWRKYPSEPLLEEGLRLANLRKDNMLRLIPSDPGLAIDSMLRFQDYLDLPSEVSEIIEQPFAVFSDVDAFAVCNAADGLHEEGHEDPIRYFAELEGNPTELFLPVEREGLLSKKSFPMMGIELEEIAALHRSASLILSSQEISAAVKLFNISHEIPGSAVSALIGNALLPIPANHDPDSLNEILSHAEKQIGPESVNAALIVLESEDNSREEVTRIVEEFSNTWTMGAKKILFIRAAFPDQINAVRSKVEFQERLQIISGQFEDMSYGQTRFSVTDVTDEIYRLPYSAKTYETSSNWFNKLYFEAVALVARDGFSVDDYDIVVVATPPLKTGSVGMASLGGGKQWVSDNARDEVYGTMRHEFGHNYGLRHASSWDAKDGSIMPLSSTSDFHAEYGDRYDFMGSRRLNDKGDFNVFEKRRLDWVDDSHIETIDYEINDVFRIYRFDHPQAYEQPTLALKIQIGDSETFWVMFRRKFLDNERLSHGAYVLWQHQRDQARLLDMVPEFHPFEFNVVEDEALALGNTFTDPSQVISLTPVATGGSGGSEWLDVRVEIDKPVNRAPQVQLRGFVTESAVGVPVRLHARSFDSNGDELVYRWGFGDGETSETKSNTIEHVFLKGGVYLVRVEVSDPFGGSDSDSLYINIKASSDIPTYQEWIETNLSKGGDGWDRRPEDDYDSDGFSNIMEYGLGLNPGVSDPADTIDWQISRLMRGETIELLCRSNDSELVFAFYISEDLNTWEPIPVIYDEVSDSWFLVSDRLELVAETNTGDGLWKLAFRLKQHPISFFLRFGLFYNLH